ncbi:lipocalin-like domain-containing protein [Streptomyces sp. NPDC058122]|uniref:lipocalin-like domain-containing protein n=1 Tax=Streptomyces sp. NPDC058122 TaxID=3346349 RepID=UPI0036E6453E
MHALIGDQPRHYQRLALTPGVVQDWEDGLRTDPSSETFEWWYCDAHLDDGTTLTVEFHTKPPFVSPKAPLTPFVLLTVTGPDGTRTDKTFTGEPGDFSASAEGCDVVIGRNTFRGGPDGYAIHVEIEDVELDLRLTARVPPWRPATGHAFFGPEEEHYIAWLPMVARGDVHGHLAVGGTVRGVRGDGYHDHNWGNIAPRKVLDHWYWGRARIGDHTVVTLMFVSHERFGKVPLPAVLVVEENEVKVSAVGADAVSFTERDVRVRPATRVPVGSHLEYRVSNGSHRYTVAFDHEQDVFHLDLGQAGAYHRFLGTASLHRAGADGTRTLRARALWELLHFAPLRQPPAPKALPVIGHQA